MDLVDLTECPHDGAAIEAEQSSGGSLLLTCPECHAVWEWHGAWVRDLREPQPEPADGDIARLTHP
jgi:hypothetical protein